MRYQMKNGSLLPQTQEAGTEDAGIGQRIGVFGLEQATAAADFGLSPLFLAEAFENHSTRVECHDHLDLFCIHTLAHVGQTDSISTVFVFLQRENMLFACKEPQRVIAMMERIRKDDNADQSFGRVLCDFFKILLEKDTPRLEGIEQEITSLEDEILLDRQKVDYVRRIIVLRKRLMVLRRYYEQLLDVFSYIDGNENGLFDKRSLRAFRILAGKADRLYHNVLGLRDYVTQIREAYQAEVDINLNTTMKIFTVITAIFLPLTLVAGWYGMNFNMPEYQSPYGYPIVIAVSLIVVAACLLFFKKRKWF